MYCSPSLPHLSFGFALIPQETFDGDALLDLMKTLVRLDRHWIPQLPGYSLYIRPTLSMSPFLSLFINLFIRSSVGTHRAIGVIAPQEALLFIICSPVGPYYAGGFKPVSLYGTTEYVRAFPGGPLNPHLSCQNIYMYAHYFSLQALEDTKSVPIMPPRLSLKGLRLPRVILKICGFMVPSTI